MEEPKAQELKQAQLSRGASNWLKGRRLLLVLVLLLAFAVVGSYQRFTNPESSTKLTPTRTPFDTVASWPTMVQLAKSEAGKVDKEAAVVWVFARPPYEFVMQQSLQTMPLTLEFVFLRPNGEKFRIELLDSDPPTLVAVHNPWDAGSEDPPTEEYMKQLADRLAYIKVGPREVYQLTEQDGKGFAQEKNLKMHPSLSMYLEHDWPRFFGVPSGWNMQFTGDRFHNQDKPLLGLVFPYSTELTLRTDGTTGKILAREVSP